MKNTVAGLLILICLTGMVVVVYYLITTPPSVVQVHSQLVQPAVAEPIDFGQFQLHTYAGGNATHQAIGTVVGIYRELVE